MDSERVERDIAAFDAAVERIHQERDAQVPVPTSTQNSGGTPTYGVDGDMPAWRPSPPPPPAVPSAVPILAPGAAPVAPAGKPMPKREVWMKMPEDAYPGYEIRAWVNYPQRLDDQMVGRDLPALADDLTPEELRDQLRQREERQLAAYGLVFTEHNGWCDEKGNPLPQPTDVAFWKAIPTELMATIIVLHTQETKKLPNSMSGRRGR